MVIVVFSSLIPQPLATWDAPPAKDDPSYSAFKNAFERYIASRSVHIKTLAKKDDKERHETLRRTYKLPPFSPTQQPQLGQSSRLSLMPFQVDGVNWLCTNYRKFQNCILADEMGLVSV